MRKPLLITGRPGCGKTTVVQRVCEVLLRHGYRIQGFYTRELRQGGKRVGFDIVTLPEGRTAPLARVEPGSQGPRVGRYRVWIESFEALVLPLLNRIPPHLHLLVMDEIGSMELLSQPFARTVQDLLRNPPTCILATLQEKQVSRFLKAQGLLERVELWTLRYGEADTMAKRVLEFLSPCFIASHSSDSPTENRRTRPPHPEPL